MNPQDNIIALKVRPRLLEVVDGQAATEGQPGHFVQIFNLDTKEKLATQRLSKHREEELKTFNRSHANISHTICNI